MTKKMETTRPIKSKKVTHKIVIQYAADRSLAPKATELRRWAKAALAMEQVGNTELTIRIVSVDEMTELNFSYRNKRKPTNVLSFPYTLPEDVHLELPILGDLAICAVVVNEEAKEQGKSPAAHWAHMVIHGVFHLLGYDHALEEEAIIMENLEIAVMKKLGYDNPYVGDDEIND